MVSILQETHFTKKEENYIRSQWGFECYYNSFSSQQKGVAILFNNFEFKYVCMQSDNEGSLLILDVFIGEKQLTFINVYGPNRDTPDFYKNLLNKLSTCDNPVVMAGDFNLVLNQEMDTYNYTSLNNPSARNVVLEMIIQNSLIDVWREMNVEKKEYTWFKRNHIKKARLDYFFFYFGKSC